jgi:predicted amidophosphoribosyltransferase
VTSSSYDPILRRLISAHKERQALALTSFLAERLALSVHGLLSREPYVRGSRIVLVPIPSAARTVRRRGFDATASMARLAARRLTVLVDDLVTTGSSLTEAARVLRAARIPVLGAATVAATVRVRPSSSPQIDDFGQFR